jgi:hypothetical protein
MGPSATGRNGGRTWDRTTDPCDVTQVSRIPRLASALPLIPKAMHEETLTTAVVFWG